MNSPPRLPREQPSLPPDPDPSGWRSLSKPQARARLKAALQTIDPTQAEARSVQVCGRVAGASLFKVAESVMVFASVRPGMPTVDSHGNVAAPTSLHGAVVPARPGHVGLPEVDLTLLVATAIRTGKRLCVPHVDWVSEMLIPTWIGNWTTDLVGTKFGIAQPREGLPVAHVSEIELILVPGLGFDRFGNRLGRGGGFYDRFLASAGLRAKTCGVCFSSQLLPPGAGLPTDPWDVPVAAVVTDAEEVACRPDARRPL